MNVKGNLSIEDYLLEARPPRNLIYFPPTTHQNSQKTHTGFQRAQGQKWGLRVERSRVFIGGKSCEHCRDYSKKAVYVQYYKGVRSHTIYPADQRLHHTCRY
jgi:hypothetical protein